MTAEFEPVKLRSPGGDLHTAHTAIEVNNLVFGQGYTVVGKRDIADVLPAGTPTQNVAVKDAVPSKKETSSG